MNLLPSQLDVAVALAGARTRPEPGLGKAFTERDRLRQELVTLSAEVGRLTEDMVRLREENEYLRRAAEIWIHMYERQLARANELNKQLSQVDAQTSTTRG
jgi:uncharacterized coiled-coil DUF342 family protein